MSGTREATHAGSWYANRGDKLNQELSGWLGKVTPLPKLKYDPPVQDSKAIIAPHAGYSYSGPAAAWAYKSIPVDKMQVNFLQHAHAGLLADEADSKRVLLLGPSHHAYLPGVALSPFAKYATPIGDIPLCLDTIEELNKTGLFSRMKREVDEDEHSLEMHLPYIRQIFAGRDDVKLVPILVGHPPRGQGEKIAQALEPYFRDPSTYFIISSDFCHWGSRFSCMPYYPDVPHTPNPVPPIPDHEQPAAFEPPELVKFSSSTSNPKTPIWRSIEFMDHEGMDLLRKPGGFGAVEKWEAYLARTKNTICGRNPIQLLLQLLTHVSDRDGKEDYEFVFVRYEQSSKAETAKDSSVSYVSGVLRPKT